MFNEAASQTSLAPTITLYVTLALSVLSLCGNAVQYVVGKRAREAEVKAKEAQADKTDSDRKSVDVSTLNILLKTVNEQVVQVVNIRREHETERLKDHEDLTAMRIGLSECQDAHEESERERARLARELKETDERLQSTNDRLTQLEDIIKAGKMGRQL